MTITYPARARWALLLCAALILAGCGKDDGQNNDEQTLPDADVQGDSTDPDGTTADADGGGDLDADAEGNPDADDDPDADADVTDPDADADTDVGSQGSGLRLTGGIMPAGGTQMSSSFTLNGGVTQPAEKTTAQSASYRLELTQPVSEGGTP